MCVDLYVRMGIHLEACVYVCMGIHLEACVYVCMCRD